MKRVTMSLPLLYTSSRGICDTNDTKIELTLLWKAADEPVVVVVKQEIVGSNNKLAASKELLHGTVIDPLSRHAFK